MAEKGIFFATNSFREEAGWATAIGWMDYQVKQQNTFLHIVQPPQGGRPQRASSAPPCCRSSGGRGFAAGRGSAQPEELDGMQTCPLQRASAARAGAAEMASKAHEDAHVGFDYKSSFNSGMESKDVHSGLKYEPPANSEADVESFSSGLDRDFSQSWSPAECPSGGLLLGMGSAPVKQQESTEVNAGTSWGGSTSCPGDSYQSDCMTDKASFGTESKNVGDALFADIGQDFGTLRAVPKHNLSPPRLPAGYSGSRRDVVARDSARSGVMAPLRPGLVCPTSSHVSAPPGPAPMSGQTQLCRGKGADAQDDVATERCSSGWSLGTNLHGIGKCRPCSFAWTREGCTTGTSCKFCHFQHDSWRSQRPCKSKRVYYRNLLNRIAAEMDARAAAEAEPKVSL